MKNLRSLALAAVTIAMSGGAFAQAYISGSVGIGRTGGECNLETISRCERSDTSAKVIGGYSFGNSASVELAYLTFGKIVAEGDTVSIVAKPTAIAFGGAYQLQLTPSWAIVGRLGLARVTSRIDAQEAGVGSMSDSYTKTQPYFGVALNYQATKELDLELSLDGTESSYWGTKADVRTYTMGVRYKF